MRYNFLTQLFNLVLRSQTRRPTMKEFCGINKENCGKLSFILMEKQANRISKMSLMLPRE